jgi:hypothetical protein
MSITALRNIEAPNLANRLPLRHGNLPPVCRQTAA